MACYPIQAGGHCALAQASRQTSAEVKKSPAFNSKVITFRWRAGGGLSWDGAAASFLYPQWRSVSHLRVCSVWCLFSQDNGDSGQFSIHIRLPFVLLHYLLSSWIGSDTELNHRLYIKHESGALFWTLMHGNLSPSWFCVGFFKPNVTVVSKIPHTVVSTAINQTQIDLQNEHHIVWWDWMSDKWGHELI